MTSVYGKTIEGADAPSAHFIEVSAPFNYFIKILKTG
jgi:hypothetical protein